MASQPHGSSPSSAAAAGTSNLAAGAAGPLRRWSPAAWEARLLADSLRSARVVLLHGADAADRRAFIEQALLPLLSRRPEDHASMPGPVPRALPAGERRGSDPGRPAPVGRDEGSAETVLLLDDWGPPEPGQRLVPLAERLRGAGLSANPAARGIAPSRVLLILLGFEAALADAATAPHPDPFWLELAQLPQHSPHDVHLLLVTSEPSRSAGMAWLKQLMPELGEHALKLNAADTSVVSPLESLRPPPLAQEAHRPAAAAWPPSRPAAAERPASTSSSRANATPIDDEWLSSVRQAVRDVAAKSRFDQPHMDDSEAPAMDQPPLATERPPAAAPSARHAATPAVPQTASAPVAPVVMPPPVLRPTAATDEPLWEHFSVGADDEDDPGSPDWSTPVRYVPDRPASARTARAARPAMGPPAGRSPSWRLGAGAVVLAGVAAAAGWWLRPLAMNDFASISALVTPTPQERAGESAPSAATSPTSATGAVAQAPATAEAALGPEAQLNAAPPAAGQAASTPAAPTAVPATSAAAAVAAPVSPAEVPAAAATPAPVVPPIKSAGFEPGEAIVTVLAGLPVQDLRGERAQALAALTEASQPTLAVVRQDVLQNLPSTGALSGLRVVAPLFAEPVQAWVRADSSLRRWRDVGASTVDIGRDRGDGQIARSLPRDLFGAPEWVNPADHWRSLSDAQALGALRRGDVDAVLRVRASPLTAEAQAAVARGSLRALTLDPGESARVLGRYVSTPAPGGRSLRTAGVMDFLVVQGGDGEARERLAADALRSLCAAHPALSAAAGANWAIFRPDQTLPAGRPYVAANTSGAACGAQMASRPQPPAAKSP